MQTFSRKLLFQPDILRATRFDRMHFGSKVFIISADNHELIEFS